MDCDADGLMRPCQVKLRTAIPPLARNEQCRGKQLANHASRPDSSGSCAPVGAPPAKAPRYPPGLVRVSRYLTSTPVSREDRALTPP